MPYTAHPLLEIIVVKEQKYFCTNYFIDETVLEMEEKNHLQPPNLVTLSRW